MVRYQSTTRQGRDEGLLAGRKKVDDDLYPLARDVIVIPRAAAPLT